MDMYIYEYMYVCTYRHLEHQKCGIYVHDTTHIIFVWRFLTPHAAKDEFVDLTAKNMRTMLQNNCCLCYSRHRCRGHCRCYFCCDVRKDVFVCVCVMFVWASNRACFCGIEHEIQLRANVASRSIEPIII